MSEQKKSTPGAAGTAQKPGARRKKRRINRKRLTIFVFILILLVAAVTLGIMMAYANAQHGKNAQTATSEQGSALFGIKSIEVVGNTHDSTEKIIETSGVYVGQSLFFVNKKRAAQSILDAYPYVQKVSVGTPSFTSIKITIEEEIPAGVTQIKSNPLVVARSGKGLEWLDADSERVADYITLTGKMLETAGVGSMVWETRGQTILSTLFTAFDTSQVTNIRGIDFSSYTDIRLNWNNQITVKLGTDINLGHEISTMASTLPRVLTSHGKDARGQLDLSSYSDSGTENDMTVFTPENLLVPPAASTSEASGTATTTTAAPAAG